MSEGVVTKSAARISQPRGHTGTTRQFMFGMSRAFDPFGHATVYTHVDELTFPEVGAVAWGQLESAFADAVAQDPEIADCYGETPAGW